MTSCKVSATGGSERGDRVTTNEDVDLTLTTELVPPKAPHVLNGDSVKDSALSLLPNAISGFVLNANHFVLWSNNLMVLWFNFYWNFFIDYEKMKDKVHRGYLNS